MYLECTCVDITKKEWDEKMKYSRPINYNWLVNKVKRELPKLYTALSLNLYNPYGEQSRVNKDYYILVSSAIEYFIRKK